jgi:hypothetical protein
MFYWAHSTGGTMKLDTFQDLVNAFDGSIDYYDNTYKYDGSSPNHREMFFKVFRENHEDIYRNLWQSIKTSNRIEFKYGEMANASFTEEDLQMSILHKLKNLVDSMNYPDQQGRFDPSFNEFLNFFSTLQAKKANDLDGKDDVLEEITSLMDFTHYHPMTTNGLIRSVAQREMGSLLGKSQGDLKAIKEALEVAPQTGAPHTDRWQLESFMERYHKISEAIGNTNRSYYHKLSRNLADCLAKYQEGDDIRIHLDKAFDKACVQSRELGLETLEENTLQNPLNALGGDGMVKISGSEGQRA